jgi:hypothetical protein
MQPSCTDNWAATQSATRLFLLVTEESLSEREPVMGKRIWSHWWVLHCFCCHHKGERPTLSFSLLQTIGCSIWCLGIWRGLPAFDMLWSWQTLGWGFCPIGKLDFLSHPFAVVLSVIDKTQSWFFRRPARMSTHGEIITAGVRASCLTQGIGGFLVDTISRTNLCRYTLLILTGTSLTCRYELVSGMQCCWDWSHCLQFSENRGTSLGLSGIQNWFIPSRSSPEAKITN